jgi:7,8-dihydroneopterin 2',3'-cyclic phosphate phosphodiesterase
MLNPKLKELADKIQNNTLRSKVVSFLENPTFELNGMVYSGPSFDVSPGGLAYHHRYEGGYIEHVVGSAKLAFALCDVVEEVYGGNVNRDFVTAGILLHDIFKPVTYAEDGKGGFVSSPLADYLDHISLATAEMVRRDFPIELIHIVTAHYGEHGLIKPRTVEALVCHLADDADSKLNGQVLNAAAFLMQKATGEQLPRLTSKEAFKIVHSKATEGWKSIEKTVEKLKQERAAQKT